MLKKRKGLMMTGSFPCIRVGKITEAMQVYGWEHDVLCAKEPPQLLDVYNHVYQMSGADELYFKVVIHNSDAEIIHVNNEPNWPVEVAKNAADGRPVVLNVHDVTSSRPRQPLDVFEESAFKLADGLIFTTERQRDFARYIGMDVDKPTAIIGNYTTSRYFIDGTPLPHIGGLCYEGGIDDRNAPDRWRDQSPLADLLEEKGSTLHIYSDRDVSYGTQHPVEVHFPLLAQRLAQHDWGFCGVPEPNDAWNITIPNKFFDYMAAGIPVIAMNCEPMREFCDMGFGIYVDAIDQIPLILKNVDRKPFIKAILENRGRFTMLAHIEPVVKLYEELLS